MTKQAADADSAELFQLSGCEGPRAAPQDRDWTEPVGGSLFARPGGEPDGSGHPQRRRADLPRKGPGIAEHAERCVCALEPGSEYAARTTAR